MTDDAPFMLSARSASDPLPGAISELWRSLVMRGHKVVYYVYDGEFFGNEIITLGTTTPLGNTNPTPQLRMVKDRSAWELTIGTRLVAGDIANTARIVNKWFAPEVWAAYLDDPLSTDRKRFRTRLRERWSLDDSCTWTAAHFASIEAEVAHDETWADRISEAIERSRAAE